LIAAAPGQVIEKRDSPVVATTESKQSGESKPRHQAQGGEGWSDWIRMGVPLLIAVIAIAVAWHYLQPAPPGRVIIATGKKTGVYYAMATKYADFFAQNGVTLEVRETAGSAENFKLLTAPMGQTPGGDVDIAIVQGGSSPPKDQIPHLNAVAGIYYEPVMVFTRGLQGPTQLSQLSGKKIAVGAEGSGVRVLASMLLEEAGIADKSNGTTLVTLGGDEAADALSKGDIDAAFFVIAPDAPVVARLLGTPQLHLMSFDQAHAYGRRHPFLSATTLYQGAVDIKRNLPDVDTQLVAAPATIVVRDSTHSAIIELLVRAAQEINGGTTLLADAGTFPTADRSELTVSKDARYFLKNPPGFLRRTLPFWLASMIDRLVILIVPLLVVLIPMIRTMPVVLRWRVQRRIFHRYKQVRRIEEKLHPNSPPEELKAGHEELVAMDKSLATMKIPISFVEELYNLRTNVTYVRSRIETWLLRSSSDPTATPR
jgi:TRAP transporter TAXI family solute receptor